MDSSKLKKELERNFFGKTFAEIKQIPNIKNLNMTDTEIIENRYAIKQVVDSYIKCGEDQKFCQSLSDHYQLKKNSDNQFVLIKTTCPKVKKYKDITKEDIDKEIKKSFYGNSYTFNYLEIKNLINDKKLEQKEWIGNEDEKLKNEFVLFTEKQSIEMIEQAKINSFHYILLGKKVGVFKSNEIKDICIKNAYKYTEKNNEYISQTYKLLINLDLLIIINFGLESEAGKNNYLLDFFIDLISKRKNEKKITQIFTIIDWRTILQELKKKEINNSLINKHKIMELRNQMKGVFYSENNQSSEKKDKYKSQDNDSDLTFSFNL